MPECSAAAGTRYPGNKLLGQFFTTRRVYPGSEYLICNKCIIYERYIPEHQNKLNIYDLQNYEFSANFFSTEKNRKIR